MGTAAVLQDAKARSARLIELRADVDPIHAAIRVHRNAVLRHLRTLERFGDDQSEIADARCGADAAMETEAVNRLIGTFSTTPAGFIALADYFIDLAEEDDSCGEVGQYLRALKRSAVLLLAQPDHQREAA